MSESERLWREDAERHGWVMPTVAWWKRLPVIRHVRHVYLRWQAIRFRRFTASVGLGLGGLPQYDSWVLYGIARGFERVE